MQPVLVQTHAESICSSAPHKTAGSIPKTAEKAGGAGHGVHPVVLCRSGGSGFAGAGTSVSERFVWLCDRTGNCGSGRRLLCIVPTNVLPLSDIEMARTHFKYLSVCNSRSCTHYLFFYSRFRDTGGELFVCDSSQCDFCSIYFRSVEE